MEGPTKTIKYKIIKTIDREVLEEIVNEYIRNFWELQGGITIITQGDKEHRGYYQAMTKVEYK